MKLMFASDLHGSLYAATKMKERFEQEQPEKLILLGDLLYHGPRNDLPRQYDPKQVISLLNDMKQSLLCVRGNCDAEVDQMVLQFPILAENLLLYLHGHALFITHGHHLGFDDPPALNPGDMLMQGHTHIKCMEVQNGILQLNPGSLSLPKDGDVGSYLVYEDGNFILKDIFGATISTKNP